MAHYVLDLNVAVLSRLNVGITRSLAGTNLNRLHWSCRRPAKGFLNIIYFAVYQLFLPLISISPYYVRPN